MPQEVDRAHIKELFQKCHGNLGYSSSRAESGQLLSHARIDGLLHQEKVARTLRLIGYGVRGIFVRDIVEVGLKFLVRAFGAFVFNKRELVFYRLSVDGFDGREWLCPEGIETVIYDDAREIPEDLRNEIFRCRWLSVLYFRLVRKKARVVVLASPEGKCIGYGWIQDWQPFRRLFKCLGDVDYMVGPGWIHPAHRGRHYHPVLLAERLRYLAPKTGTVLTFADTWNIASLRGIERVGFKWWADVRMFRVFLVFRWAKRIR